VLALGFLGWFGLDWWKGRADQKGIAAGNAYAQVLASFDQDKPSEGFALIEALRSQYPDSAYAYAADMVAAKVHVERNELDKAAERLQRVASSSPDESLRPIARLRLARVQAALGQHDQALATLGTADMGTHQPAYLEARGDVLLATGDRAGALKVYEQARMLLPGDESGQGGVEELLDLKIADLQDVGPAAAEAPVAETP
jgi:predicted negative regulator of RcsB-dependent stress response